MSVLPTALVICAGDPAGDPRPGRMIRWLSKDFTVTAICSRAQPLGSVSCLPLPLPVGKRWLRRLRSAIDLKLGRFQSRIWPPGMAVLAQTAAALRPRFIVVQDLPLLPLALAIRDASDPGTRVFFDAREYYTRYFEHSWTWRFLLQGFNHHIASTYLSRADVLVTVCEGLAAEYTREFHVPCGVLPSYPARHDLYPSPVQPGRVRMLHHGHAAPNRRIELMIDLMRLLPPRFSLDLMLVGLDSRYGRLLRRRARDLPTVTFIDPVPFDHIIPHGNRYDVGLYLLPPTGFNTRHALPNKFFEFIQSRLALAIGPSAEMAPYVQRYRCGVVADDFTPEALATKLAPLTDADITRLKHASHLAAAELVADRLRERLLACAVHGAGHEVFLP